MRKVTVVIPCYNAEAYIERTLEALERQEFRDFCVICVDDCSTDHTAERILTFRERKTLDIILLTNQKNSGPAASRNRGVACADSEYIAFCDGDDWYAPDFLSRMVRTATEENADLVFCGYQVVNERGKTERRPISPEGRLSLTDALCACPDSMCMILVRTPLMKATPLPDIRNGEDAATVPLLAAKANIAVAIPDCLYNYYRRSGSASQKPTMKVVDSLISAFEYVKKNFPAGHPEELEFLGVKNMLYPAIITLFSIGYEKKRAEEIVAAFSRDFPGWHENTHLPELSGYKKLVVRLLHRRRYVFVRLIAVIRKIISK